MAAGVAIGPVHISDRDAIQVLEYSIPAKRVDGELERFRKAVTAARRQVAALRRRAADLPESTAEEVGFLLDAYIQMLGDSRLIRGAARRVEEDRINAEAAVQYEIAAISEGFAAMEDAYLAARVDDIREVGRRLIRYLTRRRDQGFGTVPAGCILIADEFSPADTALMDPKHIGGFATALGGKESHTAIMARSLGLPAVLGVAGLLEGVATGDQVILDGDLGRLIVNPDKATLADYEGRVRERRREEQGLARLAGVPAVTRDGVEIMLQANLELPREVDQALLHRAAGIGLVRSEFMYMNRDDLPGEDEQYEALREIVQAMDGRPVTVRTLDVGGDKLAISLAGHTADSPNPALGLRAIRLSLREPRLLEVQLAAMLRAGAHGPLRILLPMISNPGEVRQVRDTLNRVARRLVRRGVEVADPLPPLGVMIEVPGAALASDALTRAADFFAIGTNDLTMYTLAIDRSDEQVAHLYNPLHPAVLRLIQFSTETALRAGLPVCLCGEIAGDPRYTALLLGLGIRDLSMAAVSLGRVKQRIRSIDLLSATRRASLIMDQSDTGRITALLDDFNALA